jgi:hypothetical protein
LSNSIRSEDDSSPTFLPFFSVSQLNDDQAQYLFVCVLSQYVSLGTLSSSSNDAQLSSIDDNILLTKSLTISLSFNQQRESKDSSDDESGQPMLASSPQSKFSNSLMRSSHPDDSVTPLDVAVDYWTIVGPNTEHQKDKKDVARTIKSSLKSNIRILTVTRKPTVHPDGKGSSPLTMTYVTREKKQKSK